MVTDFNNEMFQKWNYTNLANTLRGNEINDATRETTRYVQQERENVITNDEKVRM